jgi:hypothetical protein
MFVTNNPFIVNKPDAYDIYVVQPCNNSLSSKTSQKNSKYNEIANGNTIFIPVGFDLYNKLGSETTIAVFGSIYKDRKKLTFLTDFIIIYHSFCK